MTDLKKFLIPLFAILVGLVPSCRDDGPVEEKVPENPGEPAPLEKPAVEPKPVSREEEKVPGHVELIETFIAFKKDFTEALVAIDDAGSAKEFEEGLEERKARLRELLAAALALPAPEEEAKRHFKTLQENFSDKSAPLIDAFQARVRTSPDREEIQGILEKLSQDAEAGELNQKLVDLYQ